MVVNLTTTTSAAFNVYIPPAEKFYVFRNASAYDATIFCSTVLGNTTAAGTGVTVLAGTTTMLFSDGTNVSAALTSFSGNLVVSTNSTSPALRVTQVGSGDAILVEDSANPDSTPFVVTSTGDVGIGKTTPTVKLDVVGTINASTGFNGTVGATTPNTGAFTTLSSTGNTTLGDASTDTVTVNGYMGVGGAGSTSASVLAASTALAGSTQRGFYAGATYTSAATANGNSYESVPATAAAAFTMNDLSGFFAANATKGAGSTITNQHGLRIADQTQGTNNYGITSLVSSGTNKWNIYASGTAANYFAGNVGIGTSSPGAKLDVSDSGGGAVKAIVASTGGTLSQIAFNNTGTSPSNVRIGASASSLVAFTAGTERMRIDSSGNVGIGTSSPVSRLQTYAGTGVAASHAILGSDPTGYWSFASGGNPTTRVVARGYDPSAVEQIRLDPTSTSFLLSSNLGIGTTTPNLSTVARTLTISTTATETQSAIELQGNRTGANTTPTFIRGYNNTDAITQISFLRGTNSNDGLIAFLTASSGSLTERMRIDSSGNVGIGTTAPGQRLHIESTSGAAGSALLRLTSTGSTSLEAGLEFFATATDASSANRSGRIYAKWDGSSFIDSRLSFQSVTSGNVLVDTMHLKNGNVGIGTSSPYKSLTIRGLDDRLMFDLNTTSAGAGASITWNGSTSDTGANPSVRLQGIREGAGASGALIVSTRDGSSGNTLERMRIDSSGNVGIGTSSPGTTLDVYKATSNSIIRAWAASGIPRFDLRSATRYYSVSIQSDNLIFFDETAGSIRMTLTSSGNVGIGTSSPTVKLQVSGSSNFFGSGGAPVAWGDTTSLGFLSFDGSGNPVVRSGTSLPLVFQTNGATERMRIDSAGRVLVGATTARVNNSDTSHFQVEGLGAGSASASLTRNSNDAGAPILYFGKTRGTTIGGTAAAQNGDDIALFRFSASDGTNLVRGAQIGVQVDGTISTGVVPGRLVFSTTADGASSPTERLRIDSSGNVLVGVTSANANGGILQLSKGITFPATQVAATDANTLDDYEEGTFTPTITGSTAAGTGTYTSQVGRYTKIGNRVYFTAYIVWTAHTGTGNMRVGALPFTSNSTSLNYNAVSVWNQNIALTAANLIQAYVEVNSTIVVLTQYPTGGGTSTAVPMDTAANIIVSGHYEV
jgi:hypothetical protein